MKKLISLFLCICMVTTFVPATAFAAATGISVTSAAYHDNSDVKIIDIKFGWDSASANSRLTVMTQRLRSAGEEGTNASYGDFTDFGYYGKQFKSWDAVIAQKDKFGILYYTDEQSIKQGKTNSLSLHFEKGDIPMDVDRIYYVYLWTYWGGQYYPDNLFMALQVKAGQLQYASATGRNKYGSFTVLKEGNLATPKPTATPTSTPVVTPKPTATPTSTPVVTPKPTATPTPVTKPKPTATPKPSTGSSGSVLSSGNSNSPTAKFNEFSIHEFEWEVLRLCNIERAKEGLDSLSMIGTLQDSCNIREKEIASLFSHTRPNGETCFTAIPDDFYWSIEGENIARGQTTPKVVVNSWMNSPGHRENILNPEYDYMGVGYNSEDKCWVQLFSGGKEIKKVTTNAPSTKLTEDESTKYYLELEAANGYISYMPVDFESMRYSDNRYLPRIDASYLPMFEKASEASGNPNPEVIAPSGTGDKTDISAGGIFERYIPISQVYGASFGIDLNAKTGESKYFTIGTQFKNETEYGASAIKRSNLQNHFVKLNYIGTYGTVDKNTVLMHLGLISEDEYEKVMKGESSDWATAYNITKDTIVISVDLYDANKNFVRTLSPACFIVATGEDGSFVTYSKLYNITSTNYYTAVDNFFLPDEDKWNSSKRLSIAVTNIMLSDKQALENLLSPIEQEAYEFVKYPELTGNKQYNTNHILSDREFVTPGGAYYQVGVGSKKIDPEVKNEIKNVVSYSYYLHSLGVGYTQRNIVTADGTLYGVSSSYDKKVIASDVKKTTANHYLTNNGDVKEIKSGKVIAADCADFDESNDGWVVGIIKNDGSFYMGYTCIEGGDGYARGLKKMLDSAKCVVPNGVVDSANNFYRWDNKITAGGIDMNAFYSGQVVQSYTLELGISKVCSNAKQIFPYEYLSKVNASDENIRKQSIYGFVQSTDGTLYGYSTTYHQSFGSYGKIERIFPVYTAVTADEGNFVGIKVKDEPTPYAIVCRYCDSNIYRWGKLVKDDGSLAEAYVCETQGGYYAADGKVYGTEANPPNSHEKNTAILSATNIISNFPQMHRGSATYGAYRRDKDERIPLLPSVYTWYNDNKGITLLERTDGSVWMAYALSSSSGLTVKTGGYESTNVFKVSDAITLVNNTEYMDAASAKLPESTKLQFADVAPDAWYATPVQWAVDKAITAGTSATTFSPDNTCTRAQILTFLWRAVGSPKMSGANPFVDVKQTDYYYDAALWANSKGMVSGTTFAGDTPCTRSATVVYLWQNAGSPNASYNGNFADVSTDSNYAQAVAWAVSGGVTSGTSATTFSPDMTCTRGQIVTFLFRALV